jgi:hypothetical protein
MVLIGSIILFFRSFSTMLYNLYRIIRVGSCDKIYVSYLGWHSGSVFTQLHTNPETEIGIWGRIKEILKDRKQFRNRIRIQSFPTLIPTET